MEYRGAASAPGKVILFGEHAVVYGATAVASALSDLRVSVHITGGDGDGIIRVRLGDIHGTAVPGGRAIDARALLRALADAPRVAAADPFAPAHAPAPLLDALRGFLEAAIDAPREHEVVALTVLLYLCLALLPGALGGGGGGGGGGEGDPHSTGGLDIRVPASELPLGAGLGSSAAFSVASAGALLSARLRHDARGGGASSSSSSAAVAPGTPAARVREAINGWAFVAETISCGTPSGIDNTVSARGGAIRFVKAGFPGAGIEALPAFPRCRLLVTNTKVPRSTRALVAGVRALRERMPGVVDPINAAMDAVAKECVASCGASGAGGGGNGGGNGGGGNGGEGGGDISAATFDRWCALVDVNHHLLQSVGVSHPAIERVCAATRAAGLHSKLTGAGGGGCVITLLPRDLDARALAGVTAALEAEGFECFETVAGGDGVLLLDASSDGGCDAGAAAAAVAAAAAAAKERAASPSLRADAAAFEGSAGGGARGGTAVDVRAKMRVAWGPW